jgi:hypothetical protein
MNDVGSYKGTLIVSINPEERDVKIYRFLKYFLPIISLIVLVFTFAVLYMVLGSSIPIDMLFFLVLLIPMSIIVDMYALIYPTMYGKPIDIYSNGINFQTNWLGSKMKVFGFISKDQIEKIDVVLKQSIRENRGIYIRLKNRRVVYITKKDDESIRRIARTMGESLNIRVDEK